MNITLNKTEELKFNNNIAEISSISLECLYDINDHTISGNFVISGDYRSHEISLNKDKFDFKIPFTYDCEDDIQTQSVIVNISDFTYDICNDTLIVNIDYTITGDQIEKEIDFIEKEEFDKFLNEHEVDLVNLNEREETKEEKEEIQEEVIDEDIRLNNDSVDETTIDDKSIEETIINNIENQDTYITYHVYVTDILDTFETITKKFNITKEIIKETNDITEIKAGMKLIIPCSNE